jgi:hypothetical protein
VPEYIITMRKHQYSASVCAKSVFQIVPKLDCIMQYFMLFPMVCSILGHKHTNVKTARINKVIISFFIELHCANIYIQQAFMQNVFAQLFPNSTIFCRISRSFQRYTANWGTSSLTSKQQGLISANYFVCIY